MSQANRRSNFHCKHCILVSVDELKVFHNFASETYDAAVCVGLLIPNHFPLESMTELLRITKTGGYIIIVGSGHQYYSLPEFHRVLAEEMHRLETEDRMRIIKRELKNDYAFLGDPILRDGIVFVIQKI